MGPGPVTRKALEKQRRRDRPGEAAFGGVVQVGDVGLDVAFVGWPEGHPPDRVGGDGRGFGQVGGQALVIGVEGRQVGSQRDAGGAGQRRHVDHERRVLLGRERERVGEDQPRHRCC